jgi:hypothetical protein
MTFELLSFTFGHVLGLANLHVPIVFILGNVLGLDEWHLPICYQNPPFNYHIPDLVQAFPKKIVGQTSHLYESR